ncbi:conserved hypothethical protein (plasmid) [Ralstonia solanacearum CMR15]|nr:conserved hypothethical protein [Ralstonia solanacearum CMR15]
MPDGRCGNWPLFREHGYDRQINRIDRMKPHPTTVTFNDVSQRIFYPATRYSPETTSFNFTANGKREYAVSIEGNVKVQNGMTVTALLGEPGNWQTLRSWVDHETGTILGICPPALTVLRAAVCVLPIALTPVYVMPLFGIGKWEPPAALSAIFGMAALLAIVNLSRAWKARTALKMLRELKSGTQNSGAAVSTGAGHDGT